MSESIAFLCPKCGVEVEADAGSRGVASRCPNCEESIIVPPFGIIPGRKIGSFVVKKRLGIGGMGEVWLAYQESLDRDVALKLLSPSLTNDAGFVERFLREAKMAAKFDHPNCIATYDAGVDDGIHYLATSYVSGEELEAILQREEKVPEERALLIVRHVATALRDSWNKFEMIHRDVKPSNIMLDEDGVVKLMDMGLARSATGESSLTMTGMIVGTPHYISPEQASGGDDIDFRTDIYSLGGTFFHLVAGSPPFDAPTAMGVISKHLAEPVRNPREINPAISPGCAALITKMMAKKPEDRHSSWEEVIKDLDEVGQGNFAAAAPPRKRRGKLLGCLLLLALGFVALLIAAGMIKKRRARMSHDDANDQVSILPSKPSLDGKAVLEPAGAGVEVKAASTDRVLAPPQNDRLTRTSPESDSPASRPKPPASWREDAFSPHSPPENHGGRRFPTREPLGDGGVSPFTDPEKKARFLEMLMADTGYEFDQILHDEQLRNEFKKKTYPGHVAKKINGRLRHVLMRHREHLSDLEPDEKEALKLIRETIRKSLPERSQNGEPERRPFFDRRVFKPNRRR